MPSSGAAARMVPIVVESGREPGKGFLCCTCCGRFYVPRRVAMRLSGGRLLSGPICPDCVILGPKGAADLIRRRIHERRPAERDSLGLRLLRELVPWERLADRRAEALGRAEAFPLEARRAAIRETREKR